MNTQELHDSMATELARRGLPAEYSERTAAELADHHRDLVEELTAAGMVEQTALAEANNRLGDQQTLLKKAVREYQRRHWCGRWPLLTFLFGPVVLLATAWTSTVLMLFGLAWLLETLGFNLDPHTIVVVTMAQFVISMLFKAYFVFLTPAAVVYLLARRASRAAMSWRWTILAASVLTLVVGTMKCGFTQLPPLPGSIIDVETGEPMVRNAFMLSVPLMPFFTKSFSDLYAWYASDFSQICQLLLPMVVASFILWRSQQLAQHNRCAVSRSC